jgi:carbonyl reductase 1
MKMDKDSISPSLAPLGRLVPYLTGAGIPCEHLLKYGWQVFSCTSPAEARDLCSALEHDVARSNVSATGGNLEFQPGAHGSGHWPSVWRAREAVDPFWARLFGEAAPVHSFDSFAYSVTSSKRKLWLHLDQAFGNPNAFDLLQGILVLNDVGEDDYTTVLCHSDAGVQALMNEVRAAFPERSRSNARVHFFNDGEVAFLLEHCSLVRPSLSRGDLLVWCSGLPHCAIGGAWHRRAVYVSAVPRSLCSETELLIRRRAADSGKTSNHDVICSAAAGKLRASVKGGDQSWPKPPFPPFVLYSSADCTATLAKRAAMLGFVPSKADHAAEPHAAARDSFAPPPAAPTALQLLDALIQAYSSSLPVPPVPVPVPAVLAPAARPVPVTRSRRCSVDDDSDGDGGSRLIPRQVPSPLGLAVVTGANRGLGLEISTALASAGYTVVAMCRSLKVAAETAASLPCGNGRGDPPLPHIGIAADLVTLPAEEAALLVADQVARAIEETGLPLVLLVNNAGLYDMRWGLRAWNAACAVNCFAPLAICDALLPWMQSATVDGGGGAMIINVSSGMGSRDNLSPYYAATIAEATSHDALVKVGFVAADKIMSRAFMPTYKVSKALLNRGTQLMAESDRCAKVAVVAVCPGWCKTRMGGKRATRTAAQGAASILWPLWQFRGGLLPPGAWLFDQYGSATVP